MYNNVSNTGKNPALSKVYLRKSKKGNKHDVQLSLHDEGSGMVQANNFPRGELNIKCDYGDSPSTARHQPNVFTQSSNNGLKLVPRNIM